ncbi:hypothetical protein AB4Z14_21980 [Terrabacter sp. 2TAF16]|uniref:hypothetical protein n=1 Tax=Terrabacter sp. 2TAF16 TaxID=3233008 RepID=UPI003F94EC4D
MAARKGLTSVFDRISTESASQPLSFAEQVVDVGADGRPDLVGSDTLGPRLILEAKFDAELTPIQRGQSYEARIAAGHAGVVLFLVPDERVAAIWPELLEGPGRYPGDAAPHYRPDENVQTFVLASGNVLAATSWQYVLAVMREAMGVANEEENLHDVAQIQGLVEWRSRVGWTPLLPGDLPARTGRQLSALVDALLGAASGISAAKATSGSGDAGAGRYVTSPGGRTVWIGMWLSWWGTYGESPVWIQAKARPGQPVDLIAAQLRSVPGLVARHDRGDVIAPLVVPPGAEIDAVKSSLVAQVRRVLDLLDSIQPSGLL